MSINSRKEFSSLVSFKFVICLQDLTGKPLLISKMKKGMKGASLGSPLFELGMSSSRKAPPNPLPTRLKSGVKLILIFWSSGKGILLSSFTPSLRIRDWSPQTRLSL